MENSVSYPALFVNKNQSPVRKQVDFIAEEPLSIRLQGKPYTVVMRTPGEEIAHVAGLCLAEGIVDHKEEIGAIAACDGTDSNVVAVTVTPERLKRIDDHLDRRNYISTTSCGICGKETVDQVVREIRPVADKIPVSAQWVRQWLDNLSDLQPLRNKTRAAHAAVIYNAKGQLLAVSEDVGRHNALDKAVGKLFLGGRLEAAAVLAMSSRISYELAQKAGRAGIPLVASISKPTALAVSLAMELGITLCYFAGDDGMVVLGNQQRLIFDGD